MPDIHVLILAGVEGTNVGFHVAQELCVLLCTLPHSCQGICNWKYLHHLLQGLKFFSRIDK